MARFQVQPMLEPSRIRAAVAALAILAVAFELIAPSRAAAVDCGETLTESVTLDADLNCPMSTGLIVFGDDITIDFDGHALTGSSANGIDNTLGFNRVTIKNGTIQGFDSGIFIGGGEGHLIRGMKVTQADTSIELGAAVRFSKIQKTVTGSNLSHSIRIEGDDNLVSQVVVVNGLGNGIFITGDRNTVTKSTVAGFSGTGLVAGGAALGNVFKGNTLSANGQNGISVAGDTTANQVTKNLCEGNGSDGIFLSDADVGAVSGNTAIGNTLNGIRISAGSDGNNVTKNKVFANRLSGIFITADSDDNVITGNTASRNRENGIESESANATIGKNTADTNGTSGIDAPGGVVDAGGNKARNNGSENCSAGVIVCN